MKKIKIGVIFGGKSEEHEVSIQSARNVISALDKNKYDIVPIGISKQGTWHLLDSKFLLQSKSDFTPEVKTSLAEIEPNSLTKSEQQIDVVFPVLHGPYGEDGSIQGMLKIMGIPFVGASVLGSAIGMDKDVQKRLLKEANIPIARFQVLNSPNEKITLPLPLFVKPANMGSSVGVSKVTARNSLKKAVEIGFSFDSKIIVEELIEGREVEVSVLGHKNPKASVPGEVITTRDWYDYEAKYIDENGLKLEIPAKLSENKIKEFQKLAIKVFKILCCEDMARVDFFLKASGKIIVNELNTIPGFTNSSMYPKLWERSGISQTKLLDELISIALKK